MMTKPLCASAVFVLLQWSVSAHAAPASAPAAPPTNAPAAASATSETKQYKCLYCHQALKHNFNDQSSLHFHSLKVQAAFS